MAAEVDGYHADAAVTVPVGSVDPRARRLITATRAALAAGGERPSLGRRCVMSAQPVKRGAQARGYRVIRVLTGHGIGRAMHEEPTVFNWPAPYANTRLTPGLVFDNDGWTVRTADRSLTADDEHMIMVAEYGPLVLTADR